MLPTILVCLTSSKLQDMRRERKGERLSLPDLLAKPHQRIPRYRLLLQVSPVSKFDYERETLVAIVQKYKEIDSCVDAN